MEHQVKGGFVAVRGRQPARVHPCDESAHGFRQFRGMRIQQ
jgi:hypothetical protein